MLRRAVRFVRWSILRTLLAIVLISLYAWFTVVSYVFLYQSIVPPVQHVAPVHFEFDSHCNQPSCSVLKAVIPLERDGVNVLAKNQFYDINVKLDVPESAVNQEMGMFMVNLTFYNGRREEAWSSARSAILRYRSPLFATVRLLFYILPLLLGFLDESQSVLVKFADNFRDTLASGYQYAEVVIGTKELQVYSATLILDARFSGVRYMMYYWPITSALFYMTAVMWLLCTTTALFVLWLFGFHVPFLLPMLPAIGDDDEDDEEGGDGALGDVVPAGAALQQLGGGARGGDRAGGRRHILIGQAVDEPEQIGPHHGPGDAGNDDGGEGNDGADDGAQDGDDGGVQPQPQQAAGAGDAAVAHGGPEDGRAANDGAGGGGGSDSDEDDDDDIILLAVDRLPSSSVAGGVEVRQRLPQPT